MSENNIDISYPRPTIAEAIYEFRFVTKPDANWSASNPAAVFDLLKVDYPEFQSSTDQTIEFAVSPDGPSQRIRVGSPRLRFSTNDGSRLIQITNESLVFNVVGPYPSWSTVRAAISVDLKRLWTVIGIDHIRRCGLRYINVVQPEPSGMELKEWLKPTEYLSNSIVNSQEGFRLSQDSRRDDGIRIVLNLSNQPGTGNSPNQSIVFDIDCILEKIAESSDEDAMVRMEGLHTAERSIFDEAITEKYIEYMQ